MNRRDFLQACTSGAVSAPLAAGMVYPLLNHGTESSHRETAYERVIRTNILHCAYAVYPPFLDHDPLTGKFSSVVPEMMIEFEKVSGIKVEWGPEIDWGNIATTLQTHKADAFCSGMMLTAKRGRVMAGSAPLFYTAVEAFVRLDDDRFDNNMDRINQPDVHISVNEGDFSEEIANRLFPQAQKVYKGDFGGEAQLFMNVASRKADLTISGAGDMSIYNTNNPSSQLRKVKFQHPLLTFPNVISIDIQETALLQLINATLYDLTSNGTLDRILRANKGSDYGVFYFPAKLPIN